MSPVVSSADELALEPRLLLRGVTAALAVAAALWHVTGALSLPAGADAAILVALTTAAAHVAWATWLVLRPSRACLTVGALASAVMLVGSGALVVLVGSGGQGAAVLIGLGVQLSLLWLILVARQPATPRVVLATARSGAVAAALLFSIAAAGGVHDHPATASGPRTVAAPAYLCHLL
ncbi:hypothetical protein NBH00_03755 [Paraconexibacter antarcticus]|uniref:Uncharacterized protein n=1 Tax=Paraconexibacter antarcticus TaxID=2949664 RepID=A0ABY5DTH1_9ACTN|nr:hypothetical protein [Paraconexibacter antarcticus]UTI65331.1 hypothetical protein NBH00_03755 [Paraconexibacter antarcticus]